MTRLDGDEVGIAPEQIPPRPLYARLLGLRHLNPGGLVCFCFFEGAFGLGVLLALAELIPWWGVPVLPATIAAMVKLNDVVAGAVTRSAAQVAERERERFRRQMTPVVGRAAVRPADAGGLDEAGRPELGGPQGEPLRQRAETPDPWRSPVDTPEQRSRQSATSRYE